ncbi:HEAT repeat domain-containing protein [Streptomyces adustus]|uniref:HEAT repeat domain-containing protein n=1 Tax=Streptomyces adustus TaxID=1609272 RepID=A0A5N8VCE4_9ACTN|nr:HEAT repeat domain-containing protein [Streptomyces adustus]
MTEINTPLAGLDTVDWAGLEHAYGCADDVPGQLRDLCAEDVEARRKALHALYGNIFHQGSRYPASAAAVPFLARMAADGSLPDRDEYLQLLAALAIGYDEAHLPVGLDIGGWRRELAEFRSRDPQDIRAEYDAWVEAAADEGERRVREMRRAMFDYERQLDAAEAELGAYEAVRGQLPALFALLGDDDPTVRAATAYLLAWFPEQAAESLPRLLSVLDADSEPVVVATALVSAGLVGDAGLVERLTSFLTAAEPVVRWAAATALARLGATGAEGAESAVSAGVLAELAAAEAEPPEPGVLFHGGDLRGYAAASLTLLADRFPEEALDAVTYGLSATSGPASFPVAAAALRLAFAEPGPNGPPKFVELTQRQQRLIRTLGSLDADTWRWANFCEIVRQWGLPQQREAMRVYAGMPQE